MHRPDSGSPSKHLLGLMPFRVLAVLVAPAAWLVAGCSSPSGDLFSTVALPSQQSTQAAEGDDFAVVAASPNAGQLSGKPELTPPQRDYLDALRTAGVQPSNDLRALSIGSYVCQAHAAGQSDQAVWESVAPMVRSDLADTRGRNGLEVQSADVDTTINHYIGIATQRLC